MKNFSLNEQPVEYILSVHSSNYNNYHRSSFDLDWNKYQAKEYLSRNSEITFTNLVLTYGVDTVNSFVVKYLTKVA